MTNEKFLVQLVKLNRLTSMVLADMIQGITNPLYLSADASGYAASVLDDVRRIVSVIAQDKK